MNKKDKQILKQIRKKENTLFQKPEEEPFKPSIGGIAEEKRQQLIKILYNPESNKAFWHQKGAYKGKPNYRQISKWLKICDITVKQYYQYTSRIRRKKYYHKNKEIIIKQTKKQKNKYYHKNKEIILKQHNKYYKKNKEKILKQKKEYQQRPEVKERIKKYKQRPEVKERIKKYKQRKYREKKKK